jgi:hypothetical protein
LGISCEPLQEPCSSLCEVLSAAIVKAGADPMFPLLQICRYLSEKSSPSLRGKLAFVGVVLDCLAKADWEAIYGTLPSVSRGKMHLHSLLPRYAGTEART